MTATELKQYIYENNKVEYILEGLGCTKIVCHSDKYTSCYPVTGDNPMGVVIKLCPHLNYYSYSRNIHIEDYKDIINLVQDVKKVDFVEAVKYLHGVLDLKFTFMKIEKIKSKSQAEIELAHFLRADTKGRVKKRCDVNDLDIKDDAMLKDFYPGIHIDLFREGIIKKTIEKFKLGYSYKWKRTIIPHYYWMTGELLGFNARTSVKNYDLFDIKKYFITPGMKKEFNLYGLYENRKEIEKQHVIVIGEAEKSVLKRDSRGDSTWVALSGKSISNEQVSIIRALNITDVVVALDKDAPIEEVWYICDQFYHHKNVYYIIDQTGRLGDHDSPADAKDRETYDYLYSHRIKYTEKTHEKYLNLKTTKKKHK